MREATRTRTQTPKYLVCVCLFQRRCPQGWGRRSAPELVWNPPVREGFGIADTAVTVVMLVIPAFGSLKQENCCDLEATLCYTTRPCLENKYGPARQALATKPVYLSSIPGTRIVAEN